MSDSDVDFSHHKETDTWRYVCRECEHDSGFH